MKNRFTSLPVLKQQFPDKNPFYTQSWAYAGLTAYFGQQGIFDQLSFDDIVDEFVITDRIPGQINPSKFWGTVFEGHIEYWERDPGKINFISGVIFTGHQHFNKTENFTSLGFDFWDITTYNEFNNAALYYQINRGSVEQALYDVVIPVGSLRPQRCDFLKELEESKQDLSIVTDDRQTTLTTNLRFFSLGIEDYLNKVGVKQYRSYQVYHSFFDTNSSRSLDQMPHKKMHMIARVNVALETTAFDTDTPYCTEKTYKILAQHRPFVILGDTKILKKLKSQGFKTFDEFCDESYDLEPDLSTRIKKSIQAIKQLNLSCKRHPKEIDAICKHNQDLFFSQQRHAENLALFGKNILTLF